MIAAHRVVFSLVTVLLACRPGPGRTSDPRTPDGTKVTASAHAAELAKLADVIDPGVQPPLFQGAPQVVLDVAGPANAIEASALEAPLEAWESMPANASTQARSAAIIQLARVLLAAESARVHDEGDRLVRLRALERLYGFFDLPMFANDRSFFAAVFGQAAKVATAGKGQGTDEARAMELVSFAFDAMKRSAALHRHAAAVLMREHPGDRHIPDVLDRLARSVGSEQPELAVRMRTLGIELRGAYVTAGQLLDQARACYVAFDSGCGDAALARGKAKAAAGDAELTKQIAEVETTREHAAKVRANENATALEPRLERAQLLVELGRQRDAASALRALLADFPDDARVVATAARQVMGDKFDLEGAYRVIASAPAQLKHRDRTYLEAAIGLRATHFAYEVMPRAQGDIGAFMAAIAPEYAQLKADILEYEAGGADLGKVLHTIVDVGEGALPFTDGKHERELMTYVRRQLPRGLALLERAPSSPEAWRLTSSLALLSDDRAKVLSFADRPIPADASGMVALQHAQLQLAIAVAWDEPARLAAAARELAALPSTIAADVRARASADLDAVRARIEHDTAARDRAIAIYRELLIADGDRPDGRTLDNLASLVADTGDLAEAKRLWQLLVDTQPDGTEYARIQILAMRGSPDDVAALAVIAKGGSNEGRIVAQRWLVELARTPKDRKRRSTELRKLLAELQAPAKSVKQLPSADGITLSGTLQVGVGYHTKTGIQVSIETLRLSRLVRLPPS